MRSENSTKKYKLEQARKAVTHGDFFFAEYYNNSGSLKRAPIFVINGDSDPQDAIICTCTSQRSRSKWDKVVQLKVPTYVRTNKIYTIRKEQLLFKIDCNFIEEAPEVYADVMHSIKSVLDCRIKDE